MKKLLAILLLTFAVSCSPSVKTVNYGTAGQSESMCKLDKGNGAVLTTDCLWEYSLYGNKSGYPLSYLHLIYIGKPNPIWERHLKK